MMWDCLLSLLPCGRKFSYEANRGLELNAEMAKQIFTLQPPGPSALLLRWREPEDGPTLVLNMKKKRYTEDSLIFLWLVIKLLSLRLINYRL